MDSIILPSEFDVNAVKYGMVKENARNAGAKSVYLSLNEKPIIMQTPEMFAPWGIRDYEGNKNFAIDLSFKGYENRDTLHSFFDKLSAFDQKIIKDGVKNSALWLKRQTDSEDVIASLYTNMVRYSKDKSGKPNMQYAPTLKVKVPFMDGKFICEVYDKDKKLSDISELETKGARITAIIQCLGIWIAGKTFGVSWKVLQMIVIPSKTMIPKGFSFKTVEDKGVADEDLEHPDEDENPAEVKQTEYVVSSEDEDDDQEEQDKSEDELEVAPSKPVVKKVPATGRKTAAKK